MPSARTTSDGTTMALPSRLTWLTWANCTGVTPGVWLISPAGYQNTTAATATAVAARPITPPHRSRPRRRCSVNIGMAPPPFTAKARGEPAAAANWWITPTGMAIKGADANVCPPDQLLGGATDGGACRTQG